MVDNMPKIKDQKSLTKAEVDRLERMIGQIDVIRKEMAGLARKSPSDAVNAFKLKLINKVLVDANELLGERYRPFAEFSVFDDDAVPSTSDVTFIMAQYAEGVDLFRSGYVHWNAGTWCYRISDSTETMRTSPPASGSRKAD